MTLRSTGRSPALLARAPILLLLTAALLAPLPALAQTAGTPQTATPSQATSSQVAPAQAAQTAPSQAAPTQAIPSQSAPSGAAPAQAAPPAQTAPATEPHSGPAYDVEIVIFRAKVALGQPENWAAETTAAATVAGGEAASGSGPVGKLLTVLPPSDYRLTDTVARLQTSGTYVPVAHAAWVQTASAWGDPAGFPLESLGINVPGLAGVIFLERGEFLHLGMTLSYTIQDPPAGLNAPPGTTFVMNETRRVRFYQRNYYDHPAFGVIALITPARGPRPPGR